MTTQTTNRFKRQLLLWAALLGAGTGVANAAQVSRVSAAPTAIKNAGPARPATISAPPVSSAAPQAQTDVWSTLPDIISHSQQVVLRVPDLKRADVAEAVRLSLVNKGAEVMLMTSERSLMGANSLTTRMALMRLNTYLAPDGGAFVISDGVVYIGEGITGFGAVRRAPPEQARAVIAWAQQVVNADQVINPVWVVQNWTLKNRGIQLK